MLRYTDSSDASKRFTVSSICHTVFLLILLKEYSFFIARPILLDSFHNLIFLQGKRNDKKIFLLGHALQEKGRFFPFYLILHYVSGFNKRLSISFLIVFKNRIIAIDNISNEGNTAILSTIL